MSRIGKLPVVVPEGVEVIQEARKITIKGKLGELSAPLTDDVVVALNDGAIEVKPANDTGRARSMWGMTRSIIFNLVEGVTNGFSVNLEIQGVGYRAAVKGKYLVLYLGYSHEIMYAIPEGITIKCESPTAIEISGADKQKVGQVASEIRHFREPEPYKGKGVRYKGEQIFMKEGKKK